MATRSRIGIQLKDDSIVSVYHHWDGYPEWLGKQLEEHYNSYQLASELIDGGDMSVCLNDEGEPSPQYYSQRGEDCPPRVDATLGAYANKEAGEEYHYYWSQKLRRWICIDMNYFNDNDPEVVIIPN